VWRLLALLLLGAVLGGAAMWAVQVGYGTPTRPTAERPEPGGNQPRQSGPIQSRREAPTKRSVFALGTLEPRGGAVLVTSPLVGTAIREVLAKEGQIVRRGETLIALDSTVPEEELRIIQSQRAQALERQQTEVALATQRVEAADLALEQAQKARGLELESQRKQLDVSMTKVEQAQDDLSRLEKLEGGPRPLVSTQQVEHQKTLVKLATAEHSAAKVALQRLEQALNFNEQKAESEKRAAEESLAIAKKGTPVSTLDRQIKLAEYKVVQTKVTAPSAGTVISVLAHSGELVSTQPLMQIADLSALECLAEVDVADLPTLKDKRDAFITCRAFRGTKIKATIERIRNVAGAATLRPVDPRRTVDRTVTTVVLKVDAAEAAKLIGGSVQDAGTALMGLQVDVEIPL
jgi:ABC exporter DevB family membrane fusion protein